MTERQGIEIDYCPTCRGVWLDRGELDKLIEGAAGQQPTQSQTAPPPPDQYQSPQPPPRQDDRYYKPDDRNKDDRYKDDRYPYGKKKKKEGFLSDLFDF